MANWLEAVGRTQAVGNFVPNVMQPMIQLEGLKLRQQQMNMLAQHQAKQNLILDEQAKAMERQRKEAEAFIPVSAVAPQLAGFPELSAHWENAVKESGYVVKEVAGERFVQRGGINVISNLMNTNLDFAQKSLALTKAGIEKQLINISQQLNNTEEPPKGKDLENLQTQKAMLQKQMADTISAEFEFNKQMALQSMKQKESRGPNEAEIKAGLAGSRALQTFKQTEKELQKPGAEKQALTVKGLDPDTKEPVYEDNLKTGQLTYASGKLYSKPKQLLPVTSTPKEVTPAQNLSAAHAIRTEIRQNPYVKDFSDVDNKFHVMKEAFRESKKTRNFVAVDQALITLFNKMTDPQSVVRESEYARTPENIGIINRIKGKAQKIMEGGAGLTSDERAALVKMGESFYNIYKTNYNQVVSDYEDLARESQINPKLIGIPYRKKGQETSKIKTADDYLKSRGLK